MADGLEEIENRKRAAEEELRRVQAKLARVDAERAQWCEDHSEELRQEEVRQKAAYEEEKRNSYPPMRWEGRDLPVISNQDGKVFDLSAYEERLGKNSCVTVGGTNAPVWHKEGDGLIDDVGIVQVHRTEDGGFSIETSGRVNIHADKIQPVIYGRLWKDGVSKEEKAAFWAQVGRAEAFVKKKTGKPLPPRVGEVEVSVVSRGDERSLPEVMNGTLDNNKSYLLDKENLPKLQLGARGHTLDLSKFGKEFARMKPGEEIIIGRNADYRGDSAGLYNGMLAFPFRKNDTDDISRCHAIIWCDDKGHLVIKDTSKYGTKVQIKEREQGKAAKTQGKTPFWRRIMGAKQQGG